jgi:hypothetical protein
MQGFAVICPARRYTVAGERSAVGWGPSGSPLHVPVNVVDGAKQLVA